MAVDKRRVVLRALPALIRVPPDEVNFLRILIQVGFVIARPPPDQLLDLRYRIVNEGRDVFQMFSFNRYSFFMFPHNLNTPINFIMYSCHTYVEK
jgi:hypothetical protein